MSTSPEIPRPSAIEPVTDAQIEALAQTIGKIACEICDLAQVDISRGRGVLSGVDRCLWTRDGRRINIAVTEDWVYVGVDKIPDEEAPPHVE